MPVKIVEIPDINTTVQKNIHDSVTRNLLKYLGLNDADIMYDTAINREVAQPDSTVGVKRTLSYGNTDKVVIEYEEERDEMNRIERAPLSYNEVPIFRDKRHGIEFTPSMVRYNVSVTVKRRAPSRAIISDWSNAIQRMLDQDRAVMITQTDFHYVIPVTCLNLIAACYRAMETNIPTDRTLGDYMRSNLSDAVTVISNMAGNGTEFAMRQTAVRLLGVITGDGPQQVKDDNQVSWTAEYQYRFSYLRPESIVMEYPIVLNNTTLPEEWWVDYQQPGLSDEKNASKSSIVAAGDYITRFQYITLPIYVPEIDYPELSLPSVGGYIPIIVGQITFDKSEVKCPVYIFNLDDIPGVDFDGPTLDYIRDSYCRESHGHCSVIKIIIYEDGIPLDDTSVFVDCEDMSVWMCHEPDLAKTYHFVIAFQMDWGGISNCQYDEIRKHPEFVDSTIDTFFPSLRPEITPETGKTYPTGKLDRVIDQIVGGGGGSFGEGGSRYPSGGYNDGGVIGGGYPPARSPRGPWGSSIRIMVTILNSRLITYRKP